MKENVRKALERLQSMNSFIPEAAQTDFKASLGTILMQQALQEDYRGYDKMMDDAASDLTAFTSIDVRKEGIEKALSDVIGSQKSRAVMDAIRYEIAKALKGLIDEQ